MKISVKLFLSVGLFATLIATIGIYTENELGIISYIDYEIHEAEEISVAALDFNVENFHTQLEMWEYAFEPNQKRLDAFESHKNTLDELLMKWSDAVLDEDESTGESFHALYNGATNDMIHISENYQLVKEDWIILLLSINEYSAAVNEGFSDVEIKRLDSIVLQKVNLNEELFDELEFNKKIDNFVLNQKKHVISLEQIREKVHYNLTTNILFITVIFIGLGLFVSYFVSRQIIIPLKKLEIASSKMSKGNLDVKITAKGTDEISNLVTAFNIMKNSIKANIEKEKIVAVEKIKTERLTAIGQIASRLAHDLRNPLSVINNEIQIIKLRDPNPNEKMQKSQERIGRAIQRMAHQLEDVMDFVRLRPLEIKEHDINEIIKLSIKTLVIPSTIKINFTENDCLLYVDSTQMTVVFNNLIFNAIQAMKDTGEITVRILENKENFVIEIEDSGPGISENNLKKIFDPLYTTKQTGTGLGLVSCKTIIEQHGGKILVRNNPTVFSVILPKKTIVIDEND